MIRNTKSNPGIKKLTRKYRYIFRVPENLNHYSKQDFIIAERKFLKFALEEGGHNMTRNMTTGRLYSA